MVTREQLRLYNGKRPFEPFRITLTSGEAIDINRVGQLVATTTRVAVVMPDDRLRWIPLPQVDRVQSAEASAA